MLTLTSVKTEHRASAMILNHNGIRTAARAPSPQVRPLQQTRDGREGGHISPISAAHLPSSRLPPSTAHTIPVRQSPPWSRPAREKGRREVSPDPAPDRAEHVERGSTKSNCSSGWRATYLRATGYGGRARAWSPAPLPPPLKSERVYERAREHNLSSPRPDQNRVPSAVQSTAHGLQRESRAVPLRPSP